MNSKNYSSDIKVPVFDGKSDAKFMRDVENFRKKLINEKYAMILEFINEWLKLNEVKLTSLTQFKNMKETDILSDGHHNRVVLRKYVELFEKKFNISLSIDSNTDSDEINDNYILYVLTRVLRSIGYSLNKYPKNNNIFYTIILK